MRASETAIDKGNETQIARIDILDVVATQGAYLLSPPNTPIFRTNFDYDLFTAELQSGLESLVRIVQPGREAKYVQLAAEEWPIGRTPREVQEVYEAKAMLAMALWNDSSWTDSSEGEGDGDGRADANTAKAKVSRAKR
ncbi:MAG: hypothetical protein M1829_004613 [Trizodia sp. TS-e1964]|nr:MAG: hypothetical protein M1829_004613 [Trizodia sp. TS-e1964]